MVIYLKIKYCHVLETPLQNLSKRIQCNAIILKSKHAIYCFLKVVLGNMILNEKIVRSIQ